MAAMRVRAVRARAVGFLPPPPPPPPEFQAVAGSCHFSGRSYAVWVWGFAAGEFSRLGRAAQGLGVGAFILRPAQDEWGRGEGIYGGLGLDWGWAGLWYDRRAADFVFRNSGGAL